MMIMIVFMFLCWKCYGSSFFAEDHGCSACDRCGRSVGGHPTCSRSSRRGIGSGPPSGVITIIEETIVGRIVQQKVEFEQLYWCFGVVEKGNNHSNKKWKGSVDVQQFPIFFALLVFAYYFLAYLGVGVVINSPTFLFLSVDKKAIQNFIWLYLEVGFMKGGRGIWRDRRQSSFDMNGCV